MKPLQVILNFVAFLLGGASLALLVPIMEFIYPDSPTTVAKRWNLHEREPGHLVVPIGPSPMEIEIECEPIGVLSSITVQMAQADWGFDYIFLANGPFSAPTVRYAAYRKNEGRSWLDWNGDGWFDERSGEEGGEIRLGRRWVWSESAERTRRTDEGDFEFDGPSGEWRKVDKDAVPAAGQSPTMAP